MQNTTKRAAVVRVQMVKERTLSYEPQITGPATLAAAARALIGDTDREHFVVMHLNTKHKIVSMEVVSVGTLDSTLVHPREVFKAALLANAAGIALAHNHPSGDTTPSPEDHKLTEVLMDAGALLGIRVVDHVVIGDGYTSIRETSSHWATRPFHA